MEYRQKLELMMVAAFGSFLLSAVAATSWGQGSLDTLAFARQQWERAGAHHATSSSVNTKTMVRVGPGQSIAAALRRADRQGGGVVLLGAGIHRLDETVLVPSGVVLRGAHRDSTQLHVYIKAPFAEHESGRRTGAVVLKKVQQAGVENLTIQYKAANFEPTDKDSMNAAWDRTVFHVPESRDTMLFVDLVLIDSAENCWIKNCRLLWAGNDPVHITSSKYISCMGNYVDRAYNKADRGQGYYNIIRSKYVLVQGDSVRRIRHFSIHLGSQYVVVRNCYLEVDVNFHNGDLGYNLITNNKIRIPNWHSWSAFQRGDPRQHQPPGPWNLLYNNDARNKDGSSPAPAKNKVYMVNTKWEGGTVLPTGLPALQEY